MGSVNREGWCACLHEGHEGEGRAGVGALPSLAPAGAGALRCPCLIACEGAARPPLASAVQPVWLVWPLAQERCTGSQAYQT